MILAFALTLGQALIIGLLLYFVRTFRIYTERLVQTHDSNVRLTTTALKLLDRLEAMQREAA